MKVIRVRLTDKQDRSIKIWTVRYVAGATNIVLGQKPRKINGWSITDHDGYERFSEGNWAALVPYFHMVADNYGFTTNLS